MRCGHTVKLMQRSREWWSAHTYGIVQTSSDLQTITDLTIRVPSTSLPKCLSSTWFCQLNLQVYRPRPDLKIVWSHLPFHQRSRRAAKYFWGHYLPVVTNLHDWFHGFREVIYWSQDIFILQPSVHYISIQVASALRTRVRIKWCIWGFG